MTNKPGGYQINQKDIDSVVNFLKITDPENATPEVAIQLLEHFKATFHELAHENLDGLQELYEKLKREQKIRIN